MQTFAPTRIPPSLSHVHDPLFLHSPCRGLHASQIDGFGVGTKRAYDDYMGQGMFAGGMGGAKKPFTGAGGMAGGFGPYGGMGGYGMGGMNPMAANMGAYGMGGMPGMGGMGMGMVSPRSQE